MTRKKDDDKKEKFKADPLWEALKRTSKPLKSPKQKVNRTTGRIRKEKPLLKEPEEVLDALKFDKTQPTKRVETNRRKSSLKTKLDNLKRLDLHGMTQKQAFASLENFMHRNHAAGYRDLLVITGKGMKIQTNEDDLSASLFLHERRGILRQEVPKWLDGPFRTIVTSYQAAPPSLGGSGALLIRLKKNEHGQF